MEVNLIDYTGINHPDPWYAARLLVYTKNTRLTQGPETRAMVAELSGDEITKELDYIANTIRSSWEFVSYTFEIIGVIRACTHQMVRTRHASFAQQAQRVIDLSSGFESLLPETVKEKGQEKLWDLCMKMIGSTYKTMHENGVPAQDCRGVLPTNVLTNIIEKIDLRNFADLVGKRENLRAQGEYADVARKMKELVLGVHPWTFPFLEPDRLATPTLDSLMKELLGSGSPIDSPRINAALKEIDKLKATWG